MLQFAVVCFASAPYKEPLNDGAYAAIVEHEMSDACQNESTTQPWLLATNFVRSERLARARLCFELSSSRAGMGSPQFRETKSPKQIAHTGKTSVFEPCVIVVVVVVVVVVCCCVLLLLLLNGYIILKE